MNDAAFSFDQAMEVVPEPASVQASVGMSCCALEHRLEGIHAAIREGTATTAWVQENLTEALQGLPSHLVTEQSAALRNMIGGIQEAIHTAAQHNPDMSAVAATAQVLHHTIEMKAAIAESQLHPSALLDSQIAHHAALLADHAKNASVTIPESLRENLVAAATATMQSIEASNPLSSAAFTAKVEAPANTTTEKTSLSEPPASSPIREKESSSAPRSEASSAPSPQPERATERAVASERRETRPPESRTTERSPEAAGAIKVESQALHTSGGQRAQATSTTTDGVRTSSTLASPLSANESNRQGLATMRSQSYSGVTPRATHTSSSSIPQRSDLRSAPSTTAVPASSQAIRTVTQRGTQGAAATRAVSLNRRAPASPPSGRTTTTRGSNQPTRSTPNYRASPAASRPVQSTPVSRRSTPLKPPGQTNGTRQSVTTRGKLPAAGTRQSDLRSGSRSNGTQQLSRSPSPRAQSTLASVLAQIRSLSSRELRTMRIDTHAQPQILRTALAIRLRAQKILDKIQGLPLKDIARIKGLGAHNTPTPKGSAQRSMLAREALARREVRHYVRQLERRLQEFMNPRALLYRRLTTELTLSDLERLVSILGGNRAVRGLRRKHKAGEVTNVVESDISNSMLGQFAAAADGPSSSSDSGGGSDESPSQDGGTEVAESTKVQDGMLTADGATPTATLTTALMKEETPANPGL
jgi:hypothetical protein